MAWLMNKEGIEIYYEVTGKGTPLVFQSGYMGIHDIWKYQVEKLQDEYLCITHDNRGFGLSDKPEHPAYYTMEKNAEDLKAIIEAVGISEPVVLVTHSIGSTAAFEFAQKYPELVRGIMTFGGGGLFGAKGVDEEIFSVNQTTPSARMNFYKNMGLCEDIAMEAAKWSFNAFTKQTRAMVNYIPRPDVAEKITQPVVVVSSDMDFASSPEAAQAVVDTLPNARVELITGCRHFPQTEKAEEINNMIKEFAISLK